MPDVPVPARWRPDRTPAFLFWPQPPLRTAISRGLCGVCPACGQSPLFVGYLEVVPVCSACRAPLGQLRSDDAPPYLTILLVGPIVVVLLVLFDRAGASSLALEAAIFVPLTLVLTLALLRPVKGGTVGLMLQLGMVKAVDGGWSG